MPQFPICRRASSRSVYAALVLLAFGCSTATAVGPTASIPDQTRVIDELIEQTWADYEIRPAKRVSDSLWCRRLYLDLVGRIPTIEELQDFLGQRGRDKRAKLVEKLLFDPQYRDEYAQHWATVWSNLLIGRTVERRSLVSREGMVDYLRDSFAYNKPYNQMVHELVTAEGTTKPGGPNFNGAVNFLIDKVNNDKGILAASSTSRIFLGLQVQCTQCHNHPFNEWKQQKFWEFNSFFRQTRALRRFEEGSNDIDHAELVNEDFMGEARDASDALVFYELRNGLTKVAYPVFIDGTAIDVSGHVSDVNRREELGRLMMSSQYLDKMIVNRMWGWLLGRGFTKPVDDLGPHNPASHGELLERLAAEFREANYDLKQLITWIVLSEPYQLDSTLTRNNEIDNPAVGETPKFSRFYLRQMTAEQLYLSMITAMDGAPPTNTAEQDEERSRWLQQFVVAFGTDEGGEATTFNGSIPQTLVLFNGELTRRATESGTGSMIGRIASQGRTTQDRVSLVYQAGLARRPTRAELKVARQILTATGGNELEMLEDLWWAILNSNEFIMQH